MGLTCSIRRCRAAFAAAALSMLTLPAPRAAAHGHEHEHARSELGVSGGAVYDFGHGRWGEGVHVHYFRKAGGEHSRWSLGGMAEQVWSEDRHLTLGLGAKLEVVERLELGVMPGVTLFGHDSAHRHGTEAQLSLHLELVYDLLRWRRLHCGPSVDYALIPAGGHAHVTLGVHVAVCF